MHPTKALGPDGMHALLYKKYWPIIGEEVISYTLNILNNGASMDNINHTHIVIIPKKERLQIYKRLSPYKLVQCPIHALIEGKLE